MNLQKEIDDFCERLGVSRNDIKMAITEWNRLLLKAEVRQKVKENKQYVGKCYYNAPMDRYYLVVSERAEDERRVTCLIFSSHPKYNFRANASKVFDPGNYYEGCFEFDGIYVDDIDIKGKFPFNISALASSTEISEDEYWSAYDNFINELKHLEWKPIGCEGDEDGNELLSDNDK